MSASQLFALSLQPAIRFLRRWWKQRVENNYLMSAGVEAQRAKDALKNVAYYQRKAAHARADLNKMQRGIYE